MKSYRIAMRLYLFLCCVLLTGGCGKKESSIDYDCSGYQQYAFRTIRDEKDVCAFAVSPDGKIMVSTWDEKMFCYDLTGMKTEELELTSIYQKICFDRENCYAYDYNQGAIVELEDGGVRVIESSIPFHTIRNMVALDGKLYVLGILRTGENSEKFLNFGEKNFEYLGETVYCINTADGSYETLSLENIVAECRTEDDRLYFYGWKEDKYYLYEYDTAAKKITEKLHQDGMRNSLAVAVGGGYMFAVTPDAGLIALNLQTGEENSIAPEDYAMFGNDLQFYRGNLFLNGREIIQAAFVTTEGELLVLADDEGQKETITAQATVIPGQDASLTATPTPVPLRDEKITICSWKTYYDNLDTSVLKWYSGMKSRFLEMPIDFETAATELMAGNSDVDIYLLPSGHPVSLRCRDLGMYVSLNESDIITDYLESCWDSVQGAAAAENGDIWMLPIDIGVDTTWYIPENMKVFGLSEQNLDTMQHYMETLERLNGNTGEYRYYNNATYFISLCDARYDLNYNDYEKKQIDFKTDLYRWLAKTLWTGWDMNSDAPYHPLFHRTNQDYEAGFAGTVGETYDFDQSRVIFKTGHDAEHLMYYFVENGEINEKLQGWRVMAAPAVEDISEKIPGGLVFAMVNPYSKQKEAAVEYLEGLITGGAAARRSATAVFLQKDLEAYSDIYDVSLPAVRDLQELYGKATIRFGYCWDGYTTYINEYQRGLITLEQALDRAQKRRETGLME